MKSKSFLNASAALFFALAPLSGFSQAVSLANFRPELNNASGTLSDTSETGFTISYPDAGISTATDTRTVLSASARGASIAVGETAVLSFTVSSTQIRNSSVEGFAFGFGFDMGPEIATTQIDVGDYAYTFMQSGAGTSGFPFARIASGAGNSSKAANNWLAGTDPVPGTPLAAGKSLSVSVGLARTEGNNYAQSVSIDGSPAYTSQFTLSGNRIETVYILVGGSGFNALNPGDNITVTNVALQISPAKQD